MINYLYDGSFQGFLTACYDAIEINEVPEKIIINEKYQSDLFSEKKYITADKNKSLTVINTLNKKFDYEVIKNIYYSFLSEKEDIEKTIFDYISSSLRFGKKIDGFYANDCVNEINRVVRQVSCEKHRLIGIIRFKLLKDGIFYSSIEPDNNVTGLLVNHFKKRFSGQKWLIHDIKRNIGAYYNLKNTTIISIYDYDKNLILKNNDNDIYHENEMEFQNLWKTYFKNISIKERINPKLQRQFIPVRYWKYLVEKN